MEPEYITTIDMTNEENIIVTRIPKIVKVIDITQMETDEEEEEQESYYDDETLSIDEDLEDLDQVEIPDEISVNTMDLPQYRTEFDRFQDWYLIEKERGGPLFFPFGNSTELEMWKHEYHKLATKFIRLNQGYKRYRMEMHDQHKNWQHQPEYYF